MVAHDLGERNHDSFHCLKIITAIFGRRELARANIKSLPEFSSLMLMSFFGP